VIGTEQNNLEFESLPEFIREPGLEEREFDFPKKSNRKRSRRSRERLMEDIECELSQKKTEELEALWPGVNHDYLAPSRRTPSFYLTLGFLAGAIFSLAGVWGYAFFTGATPSVAEAVGEQGKIVVAGGADASAGTVTTRPAPSKSEVVAPLYPSHEVQSGDTLAGIAMKAYKRVSPRLLDEICKATGLKNANVLILGQKLKLPEYRSQTKRAVAGAAQAM
jgi:LysM repeat protein